MPQRPCPIALALSAPFTCLLLTACGPGDADPGPGGVTIGEAQALDEAAAMIEQQAGAGAEDPATPPASTPAETR